MQQAGDALADLVVKLVEHHVVFGRVVDRVHDFRWHQRRGHRRVGAGCIDEGTHPELAEVVASGLRWRRHRRRGRPAADQPSRHRQSRDDFEKTSSTPHLQPPGRRERLPIREDQMTELLVVVEAVAHRRPLPLRHFSRVVVHPVEIRAPGAPRLRRDIL